MDRQIFRFTIRRPAWPGFRFAGAMLPRPGTPTSITIDHGTEFTSKALEEWAYRRGMKLDFSIPENLLKTGTSSRLTDDCVMSV